MAILGGTIGVVARPMPNDHGSGGSSSGVSIDFSTLHGTSFILQHDLGTTNLFWKMFITSISPIRTVIPDDIVIIGPNHIQVELQTPMQGVIQLVGI